MLRNHAFVTPSNIHCGIRREWLSYLFCKPPQNCYKASFSSTKHIIIDEMVNIKRQDPLQALTKALPTIDEYLNFKSKNTHRLHHLQQNSDEYSFKDRKHWMQNSYRTLLYQFISESSNPQLTLRNVINELINETHTGGYNIAISHVINDLMTLLSQEKLKVCNKANGEGLDQDEYSVLTSNADVVQKLWKRAIEEEEHTEKHWRIPLNVTTSMYTCVMIAWKNMLFFQNEKERKLALVYAEKVEYIFHTLCDRFIERDDMRRAYPGGNHLDIVINSWIQADPTTYGCKRSEELLEYIYFNTNRKSLKIVPFISSCNRIIEAYVKCGKIEQADQLLLRLVTTSDLKRDIISSNNKEREIASSLSPNHVSFDYLIEGWSRSGKPDNAYRWLKRMYSFGGINNVRASLYSHTLTLAGIASYTGENVDTIDKILKRLSYINKKKTKSLRKDSFLPFKNQTSSELDHISPEMAERIVLQIEDYSDDVQFLYSYGMAFCAWSVGKHAGSVANRLLKQMEDHEDSRVQAHLAHYYLTLFALSKDTASGVGQQALDVYDRLKQKLKERDCSGSLSISYFNLTLKSLLSSDDVDEDVINKSERMVEALKNDSLEPNRETYNLLLQALATSKMADSPFRCKKIIDRMRESKDKGSMPRLPDLKSYSFLVLACALSPEKDETTRYQHLTLALSTFTLMGDSNNIKPNELYYNWLLMASIYLTSPGNLRDKVMNKVYSRCKKDGCLNEEIKKHFKANNSKYMETKLFKEKNEK